MTRHPHDPRLARSGISRLVAMEVVSGIGDGVFWVGLAAILLKAHSGTQAFTLAALARLGPRALISAPAGVLADRVDRRALLVRLDLARAALMVALAWTASAGSSMTVTLVLMLCTYTLAAPYRPALTAALPAVAGESRLAAANALVSTVRQLMTFIGPLFGAVVISLWSPTVAFALNGASFLIAAALVASVKSLSGTRHHTQSMAQHRAHWVYDIRAGWHEVASVTGLAVIMLLVFAMYAARGAELMLFVLVADGRLDLGAPGVGVLTGAVGLGALAALPLSRRLTFSSRPAPLVLLSVASSVVAFIVLSVTSSVLLAFVTLVVLGAGVVVFEVLSVVLLQRLVRRETLGAVFGLIGTVSNSAKLLGALATPVVASHFGTTTALLAASVTIGALALMSVKGVARLSRTTRARQEQLRPLVEVLSRLALFEHASAPALERIAAAMDTAEVEPGAVLIRQGDVADHLYVARAGHFQVWDRGVQIHEVLPGEWFGEIGLLRGSARTATVIADQPSVVWRIPGALFLSALEDSAGEPAQLLDVMADRLARSGRNDQPD